MTDPVLAARARVLHDLAAQSLTTPAVVSLVEDAAAGRRWWVQQWPAGAAYVAGQIAQDVQDRLLDTLGRWPRCPHHIGDGSHALQIAPELGADPHWVCEVDGVTVAPLGELAGG